MITTSSFSKLIQEETATARKVLKTLRLHQQEFFKPTELPYLHSDIIDVNKKILSLIGEFGRRTIGSSIAITAIFMEQAHKNKLPIISWWSGKDNLSLSIVVEASKMANLHHHDFSIYVVNTPFLTENVRKSFKNAIKSGINLNIIPSPDKLLSEKDCAQIYGPNWRDPSTPQYLEVMTRIKEIPTRFVMERATKRNHGRALVIRGVRSQNNIYTNCLPIGTGGDQQPYTYIFPLIDIDQSILEKYQEPVSYFDPSRARNAWVAVKNGKLILSNKDDPNAQNKSVIIYPDGDIYESNKTSCALDDQFPFNPFAHRYTVAFPIQ